MQLLGMAGLAEAAMAQMLAILFVGLIVLWTLITIAVLRKSVPAAAVVLLIVIFSAVIFQPWTGLFPVQSEDGDVHFWAARFRALDALWFLTFIASVALLLWTKRQTNATPDSKSTRVPRHLRRISPP